MKKTITVSENSPLSDQLTVIITTSPTPSTPATDLIEAIIVSFQNHCPLLLTCTVIVVCDTFERIAPILRLKKGQATPEIAAAYTIYKQKLQTLILSQWNNGCSPNAIPIQSTDVAEYGSPGQTHTNTALTISEFPGVTFIEPRDRLGFGLAVRSALRRVATPYVWVQQHDWALDAGVPIAPILSVMRAHDATPGAPVRYVCLPSVRMLGYASSMLAEKHPVLRRLTAELKGDYVAQHGTVALTPMFFWHDKTHVASTQHYLQRVFPSRLAMPRGAFIEDTIGHRARDQMKEGMFEKWATWMYYPNDGRGLCLRHLDGRMWKGVENDIVMKQEYQRMKKITMERRIQERKQNAKAQDQVTASQLWTDES
ncbi:hypothetical protein TD95_003826 [Thielaviopsis punctulata]|uniref:Uncharacterized protein n=1 Tax=Thielaviopsis punctulata TaxID=72032 RepID=A0A0F4ZIQ7_9PEZI|nr:hypothetical protein TD95_003826 [Thielaviopsis punctulata]